jgi:cyclohexadienyl dehydratase
MVALAFLLLVGCAPALRVATSGDYAPFSTMDADGARGGLDIVTAERLAADLGMRLEWVPLDWPQLSAELEQGRFDVALSGVTMRPERALIGRYARPYAMTNAVAVVRPADASRWRTVADLDQPGVRLAVNAGGHLERVARARFPRATIVPIADNRIVAALAGPGVDALVTDTAELAVWPTAETRPIALPALSLDHKAPLLPVDRATLAARIDDWLMAREADGWLNAQRVRALGSAASLDASGAASQAVAALITLRLGLMPDVAAAKRQSGQPIEDLAQEARVLERVRGQVPAAPERAAAVYAVLIDAAKTIQRQTPTRAAGPSLDALRAALGRIDEALCRELERLPALPADAWRAALAPIGLPAGDVEQLATALAT